MNLIRIEKFSYAIITFTEAIQIDATDVDALNGRGDASYNLGEFQKAFSDDDKAIELNPELIDIYLNRRYCYSQLEEHSAAIEEYKRALVFNPRSADVFNNLGGANWMTNN
jgi:tetratricopeptide (TPR) repeat protein